MRGVIFRFVDIGGIVDHHCLHFLFMTLKPILKISNKQGPQKTNVFAPTHIFMLFQYKSQDVALVLPFLPHFYIIFP
jgi:hypothetical protein